MRMTQNKKRVLEALAHIDANQGMYPPYNAIRVQEVLNDSLGYGGFDLANLTRTLKSLVDQGRVKCSQGPIDMSGTNGFVQRWFEQQRMKYWPADLDLDAMRVQYKITPEDYDLRFHNFFQRRYDLPELTMEEFREYNAHKAATCM
jgi:hypothetical protein